MKDQCPDPNLLRDLGDSPRNDMARRFDFCLTYDRALAVEAARGLLARIPPR